MTDTKMEKENNLGNYRELICNLIQNSYTESFEWLNSKEIQNKLRKIITWFKEIDEIYIQLISLKYYAHLHKKEYYRLLGDAQGKILTKREKEPITTVIAERDTDKQILDRKQKELIEKRTNIKYEMYNIGYLLYQFNKDMCIEYFDEEYIKKYSETKI